MLLEGPPLRLPKVQLPSAVSHSSVFICCLYKELFIGVLQAGWLSLREVTREKVRQARSYELQQLNLSSDAGGALSMWPVGAAPRTRLSGVCTCAVVQRRKCGCKWWTTW